MAEQRVGEVLDALDIVMELGSGEHVTDVLVIAKVTPIGTDDDTSRLAITSSRTSDWITCVGLAHAATRIIDEAEPERDED